MLTEIKSVNAQSCLSLAKSLAEEFAVTAIARDKIGGTPKYERDRIRDSGLLKLLIPQEYGGWGQSWQTMLQVVREFAKVDSSLAHVFSYHHLGVVIPHVFGSAEQKEFYYAETIRHNWFWCNALNPLDLRTTLIPEGDGFRLHGIKSFCSGSKDSDIIPITAVHSETGNLTVLVIPTQREGVQIQNDWENMGQRQTDSGSVRFENVKVYQTEVIGDRTNTTVPFKTIRACLSQLNLANIYLGIAQGAFAEAKNYTTTLTKRPLNSDLEPNQDPYILHHFGNLWVDLESVNCLIEKAANLLQTAWEKQESLSDQERGECAIAISIAKVAATKVSLEVTNRIFELMGARSTASKYGFDRHWRNLRTFSLHDSLDYKIKAIGNFALNDQLPKPGFYI